MKVVLEFDLPEDEYYFQAAINGKKLKGISYDYDEKLRSIIKYNDLTDEEYQTYQKCRDIFRQMFYDENLFIEQ
jgi:hypothetical protein